MILKIMVDNEVITLSGEQGPEPQQDPLDGNGWVYIDGIKKIQTATQMLKPSQALNYATRIFHCKGFGSPTWYIEQKQGEPECSESMTVVKVTYSNHDQEVLIVASRAYLLNEQGKTIDTI